LVRGNSGATEIAPKMALNDPLGVNTTLDTFTNGTAIPVSLSTVSLYTPAEKRDLRIIAISFASISLIAGIVMIYWFIRLQRRTFRHMYLPPILSQIEQF
jgi:G protein-coupled glucose receptor regulating Gpa2